jgi:polyvinyl alcohol dehydrogenase (cytochrome)
VRHAFDNLRGRPGVVALALLLAACTCDEAPVAGAPSPAAAPPTAQVVAVAGADGEALYLANCAQCHEGQVLRAPHRSIAGLMASHRIVAALESGVMKEPGSKLAPEQRRAVAEYLTGMPYAEPAPASPALMCAPGASPFDFDASPGVSGWGVDRGNSHFYPAAIAGIDREQVPRLELKWAFAFPDALRARSQPVLGGGALYVGSHDGTVYALDRLSGCVRWRFTASAEVRTGIVLDGWRPGDTDARPGLYFGDLTGNVYAVDAQSGELRWRDRPDEHPSLTITAAPIRFEDQLYVALSSLEVTAAANPDYACCTFQGGVIAYEAASGKRLWLSRVIGRQAAQVAVASNGTARLAPSGAPVWGTPALDAKRRRLYLGTGENYSSPADDRSDAILAFDADSGATLWSWQATARDAWNMGCEAANREACPPENGPDFDFGAAPMLLHDATRGDILIAGQKSGEVHALDPDTGKLLWQRKLGRGGIQGGVHFGMSAEGATVFAPISDFFGGPRWPGEGKPGLYALNAWSGSLLWQAPATDACAGRALCNPGVSQAIAGLPGVVFAGGMDGWLRAHDSTTGALLWQYDTAREFEALGGLTARGGSLGGGAAPVFADGVMYVMSGYGIYNHMPGNVLLAFAAR